MAKPKPPSRDEGIVTGLTLPFILLWLLERQLLAVGIISVGIACIRPNKKQVLEILLVVSLCLLFITASGSVNPHFNANYLLSLCPALFAFIVVFQALVGNRGMFGDKFTVGEAAVVAGVGAGAVERISGESGIRSWLGYFAFNIASILVFAVISARLAKGAGRLLLFASLVTVSLLVSSFTLLPLNNWKTLLSLITASPFLLLWWPTILAITFAVSSWYSRCRVEKSKKTVNFIRKFYHFVAVALFVPAHFKSPKLLAVALGFALLLFLGIEALRLLARRDEGKESCTGFIAKISEFMERCQSDLDGGRVILSHIYLLLGCAIPVWLNQKNHHKSPSDPASLAGIVSLGIGDAVASIAGIAFGKHRWPRSSKTLEGSLAGFLASSVAWLAVAVVGTGQSGDLWKWTVVSAGGTLWESLSRQNDNLTLPLLTLILIKVLKL